METTDLLILLEKIGIDIIYQSYLQIKNIPFIVVRQNGTVNFISDNKVYFKNQLHVIELYTETKAFELEEKIEELFNDNEIIWNKSEDIRIESEGMNVIYYYI